MNTSRASVVKETLERLTSIDYAEILRSGVELRNNSQHLDAEIALTAAVRLRPSEWQPKYEIGILHLISKNPRLAQNYFEDAFLLNRSTPRLIEMLVGCYASLGKLDEAKSAINLVDMHLYEMTEVVAECSQYIDYIGKFSPEVIREHYRSLHENYGDLLTAHQVIDMAADAVQKNHPFALVRLGDGEGTWLYRNANDEAGFERLYRRNRDEFWNIWFGAEQAVNTSLFYKETARIKHDLKEADVIGIPPLSWTTHEYETGNFRGCSGTFNAVRLASEAANEDTKLCSQLIHYELDKNDDLRKLLSGRERVGIVSCHPTLCDYVKSTLNVKDIIFIPVPGEPSRRHLLGEESVQGTHFPDRFLEIISSLSDKDYSGMIFIVAGGILGKLYTLMLRKAGAVALDIGSTADKWMNKKTRPGF